MCGIVVFVLLKLGDDPWQFFTKFNHYDVKIMQK